jgi:UDP-glucose 4-epimerase
LRCLILGGGGFIGSHLCEELVAAGLRVRIFERPNVQIAVPRRLIEQVEWREGDFTNPVDVEAAIAGCDVIFHLISTTLPKTSNDNPIYDLQTNLVPTVQLLELLRSRPGRKVIFVSSGGTVYGRPSVIPIPETHPTQPLCAYGITKLASEKYLSLYRELYGVGSVVVRLSNPFGERQHPSSPQGAIAVFLHKAMVDETVEIWGDGEVVRDYLYVKDAARALVQAISYKGPHQVFNIGSNRGLSLNAVLREMEELLGRPIRKKYSAARNFDVSGNVLDTTLARGELGWAPATSFQQGLQKTLRWMETAARSPTATLRELLPASPAHLPPPLVRDQPERGAQHAARKHQG